MTQHNHTQAETWLRNAPSGAAQHRTATDENGLEWSLQASGLICAAGGYAMGQYLPPGTYTLNYREGLELDAAEAWEYLAGGEERRVKADWGEVYYRVRKGRREFRAPWCAPGEWVSSPSDGPVPGATYTIAPDEPARGMWTTPASGGPIPEATIDHNVTPEQVATAAVEPSCCREARERVSELEGETADLLNRETEANVEHNLALERIADLEAKLSRSWAKQLDLRAQLETRGRECTDAEDARGAALARIEGLVAEKLALGKERDAAIAERDKLRAEVERLTSREPTQDEGDAASENGRECFVDGWTGNRCRLCGRWTWGGPTAHIECVTLEPSLVTLPADTTTPLDLAQRAVALMGGRDTIVSMATGDVLHCRVGHNGHPVSRRGSRNVSFGIYFSPVNIVTLAPEPEPEPEPERRKLTFGEAMASDWHFETDHGCARYAIRDWCDGDTTGRGVFRWSVSREEWDHVPIVAWMTEAEWTGVAP